MTHGDHSMVSSRDVNGTPVHGPNGKRIGEIDYLMIDKKSGRVAWAVMRFGGFLGIGEGHHQIPWNKLNYDQSLDGFMTDITAEQLRNAPPAQENWRADRDWEQRMHLHYGIPPYWL